MKTPSHLLLSAACLVALSAVAPPLAAQPPADPGWPRVFQKDKKQLTVYQPQVDYWNGYTNIHFRCAVAVKGVTKQEKFGVAEVDAVTVADQAARIVALVPTQRELRFPNTSDSELAALRRFVDEVKPPNQAITLSLDRVLAYLNPGEQSTQKPIEVNLDPPKIFYSRKPAILVMFLGEPQLKPVETNRTDLMFALNTNWDFFYDPATQRYFLLSQNTWLTAPDLKGPWTPAQSLPPAFSNLPANDNWADVRQNIPPKPAKSAPVVFVTTEPAELIITQGEASYSPVKGTRLMRVANTDSVLFLHSGEAKFYFLVAGRWFRAASLAGPWTAASANMPDDFLRIPDTDPAAFVKASVPGTREAKDAVLLASVPTTTTVSLTNATVNVIYNGAPQFVTITNTVVQYAVNSPQQVFLVSGKYYCCDQGVWFVSSAAIGPWAFCASVPPAIYTIPPSNPNHNVTYVVVQSSTPTTVVYSQTSGYSGEYVAATGVLMFGMGMLMGAAIADHHHYCYPPPCHYSYGCGATYHYGYGGYYYKGGAAYGPYGGAGYVAAYNPHTGTYARSSYAYGPYGSATRTAAYNPYTGARAVGGTVNTAYGSAGRSAGYNPSTGNAYRAGYRENAYGSAAGIRTSQGSGAVAWDTQNSQGGIAKTRSGDVYAAKDGTVYKKDPNGNWSQNSGSGWQSTGTQSASAGAQNAGRQPSGAPTQSQRSTAGATGQGTSGASRQTTTASTQQQRSTSRTTPETTSSSSGSQNRSSMESQAQARQYGNQQAKSAQSWQGSSGSPSRSSYSGGSRGGGGRRR